MLLYIRIAAIQVNSLLSRAQAVGALPVIQHFLDTLQLREILAQSRPLQAYVPALELLVKSLLVEPNALYRVRPWSQQYDPRWIGPGSPLERQDFPPVAKTARFHSGADAVPSEDHFRWPPCSAGFFVKGGTPKTHSGKRIHFVCCSPIKQW